MTRSGGRQLDCPPSTGGGGGVWPVGLGNLVRNLRLERQESEKSEMLSVTAGGMPPTIHIDDDDDDVHISSPRSFAQARSAVSSSRQRSRAAESRASAENRGAEDLLELRLGPTNFAESSSLRLRFPIPQGVPLRQVGKPRNRDEAYTIDLTDPAFSFEEDCVLVNKFVQKKRKPVQPPADAVPEPAKDLKLTCAICMDSMKEETSTICGHLFCRVCIHGAIQVQKKCPTCRQTLSQKQTHRIYISGSLRNP